MPPEFLSDISDNLPKLETFTPNLQFYDTVLSQKQQQYNQGFSQLSSIYSSILNLPMTNQDNIDRRNDYFKNATENLQKIAGMDLSQQSNVNLATKIFAPIYNDPSIKDDMGFTNYANQADSVGNSMRNSVPSTKDTKDNYLRYSSTSMQKTQQLRQQYANTSDPNERMNIERPSYTPDFDVYKYLDDNIDHEKYKVVQDVDNGKYTVETVDGKQIEGLTEMHLMNLVNSNSQIQDMYRTHAFVDRNNFINQYQLKGYQTPQDAEQAYTNHILRESAYHNILQNLNQQYLTKFKDKAALINNYISQYGIVPTQQDRDLQQKLDLELQSAGVGKDFFDGLNQNLVAYKNATNQRVKNDNLDAIQSGSIQLKDLTSYAKVFANRNAQSLIKNNPADDQINLENLKYGHELEKQRQEKNFDLRNKMAEMDRIYGPPVTDNTLNPTPIQNTVGGVAKSTNPYEKNISEYIGAKNSSEGYRDDLALNAISKVLSSNDYKQIGNDLFTGTSLAGKQVTGDAHNIFQTLSDNDKETIAGNVKKYVYENDDNSSVARNSLQSFAFDKNIENAYNGYTLSKEYSDGVGAIHTKNIGNVVNTLSTDLKDKMSDKFSYPELLALYKQSGGTNTDFDNTLKKVYRNNGQELSDSKLNDIKTDLNSKIHDKYNEVGTPFTALHSISTLGGATSSGGYIYNDVKPGTSQVKTLNDIESTMRNTQGSNIAATFGTSQVIGKNNTDAEDMFHMIVSAMNKSYPKNSKDIPNITMTAQPTAGKNDNMMAVTLSGNDINNLYNKERVTGDGSSISTREVPKGFNENGKQLTVFIPQSSMPNLAKIFNPKPDELAIATNPNGRTVAYPGLGNIVLKKYPDGKYEIKGSVGYYELDEQTKRLEYRTKQIDTGFTSEPMDETQAVAKIESQLRTNVKNAQDIVLERAKQVIGKQYSLDALRKDVSQEKQTITGF